MYLHPAPWPYGVPFGAETGVLAYRTDILAKHGIAVPKTYDELLRACRTVKDKEGIGGLTSRGQTGHQVTAACCTRLNGGNVFDQNFRAVLNNPAGARAESEGDRRHQPPGRRGPAAARRRSTWTTTRWRRTAERPRSDASPGHAVFALLGTAQHQATFEHHRKREDPPWQRQHQSATTENVEVAHQVLTERELRERPSATPTGGR